ncbi:MAG: futalosine hydrolase [Lewinellaceae bacterium]|nr:futalosine hydrolase [Lewinellaceae bacterium]
MKIVLLAATPFEIAPVLQWLDQAPQPGVLPLISGVGATATTWALARHLANDKPDLVINAGIAGAIDRQLQLGDVVHVVTERFADLGVEEADGRFTDLFDLGLLEPATPPYINGRLENPSAASAQFLTRVHGITVNRVHGSEQSIAALHKKYPEAAVESMEGAAVFYACLLSEVPFLEIRSISNYVEPRNREAWNLPFAIEQLNQTLIELLKSLHQD